MGVGALLGQQASNSRLPPLSDRDLRTCLSYNLRDEHIAQLYRIFLEVDTHCNGVWTVSELYNIIQEPRQSMRAPIIDAVFFMGDSLGQGSISFQDFIVTFCSFCALSKEEMLQLLFMIVDRDRNGHIDKQELLEYFSYVPDGGTGANVSPIFPVNNKNALDKFRGGRWKELAFDGLAQLMELFPYIVYPAYHTQDLYRRKLLGESFWTRLDAARLRPSQADRTTWVQWPGYAQKIKVKMPGRCSMLELLEYSRRKTAVQHGRRVVRTVKTSQMGQNLSSVTKERDEEISRCPLLSMIRNPLCMYYVPYIPDKSVSKRQQEASRPEFELPDWEVEGEQPGLLSRGATTEALDGLAAGGGPGQPPEDHSPRGGIPGLVPGLDSGDSDEDSSDEDDEDDEDNNAEAAVKALHDMPQNQRQRRNSTTGEMDPAMASLKR